MDDLNIPAEMIDPKVKPISLCPLRERIADFWKENRYCDFNIIIEDKNKLPAHKLILAASSEFFHRMFNHENLESVSNELKISDTSTEVMRRILKFCYTSELKLDGENVQDILIAAHQMQFLEIQSICIDYIDREINTENCIGVLATADRLNLIDLYEKTLKFCLDNFELILNEKEFLEIEDRLLETLLSSEELNISEEEILVKAIMNWLNHDIDERKSKVEALMLHVRFATFSLVELVQLTSNFELLRSSTICRDLIDDAKNYRLLRHYSKKTFSPLSGYQPNVRSKFEARLSIRKHQRIYVIGGWTNETKPTATVEKFDPYNDSWTQIRSMTKARCGVGAAILDKYLYAIGGYDGMNYTKSVERMNIENETWYVDVKEMISERTSVGVVVLDGFIYAIGGQSGRDVSDKVEKYDPEKNIWQTCVSMQERRLGAGVTVLDGLIYVVGGSDKDATNTVEYFDPKSNKWTYAQPMDLARKHLGCTTLDGKIYAVGGKTQCSETDTAECYDPASNTWTSLAPMSRCRSGISLVELDGLLYAIGGHSGDLKLRLVEVYDPTRKCWRAKKSMNQERLGAGSVVYSKFKP